MTTAIIFQIQSFLILSLIFVGIYYRRKRSKHVKIMGSAILWDIILILQIELGRGAIATAVKPIENKMMLNIHISIAVLTVLFYFAMIFTGRSLISGNTDIRSKHKALGWCTVALRVLTFITSFFAV